MAIRKVQRKLYASEAAYLDPLDCGSLIGYSVIKGRRGITGEVDLTDCNRKITWYFGGSNSNRFKKIDKAIELLENFKAALKAAEASNPVRRKKKEK